MDNAQLTRISKQLSLHLRHAPERIGLRLRPGGWADVDDLLAGLARHGTRLSRTELAEVVARNDKQRFAFDPTGSMIRASQGHTTPVDLELPSSTPPPVLFHGTVEKFLSAIEREGLRPMGRHDVHLSDTVHTAVAVGRRRGRPVVLRVDAAAMARHGYPFRVSANGVWLTAAVPPAYLARFDERSGDTPGTLEG